MRKYGVLLVALLAAIPFVSAEIRRAPATAVGTWSSTAVAALDISIRDDGTEYALARGTHLLIRNQWGSNNRFSQSWAAHSIAMNPTGTHCVMGESGKTSDVWVSTNSCQSWTSKNLTAATDTVQAVAISSNGSKMFAAFSSGELFTSVNSGSTFIQRSANGTWTDIAVDADGNRVVATMTDGKVFYSTDSAANMTQVLDLSGVQINAVASSSTGGLIVIGDVAGSVYASTNYGATWSTLAIPNTFLRPIADVAMSADGSKMLVALDGGKLLRSADSGATWVEEDSDRAWTAVAISPSGTYMGAGTATDFYRSSSSLNLASSTPAHNSTTALNDANIVLNFNNVVSLGAGKNFYIKQFSDNSIFETIPSSALTISTPGRITLNPQGTLDLSTSYYVDADSGTVTDDYGNQWSPSTDPVQFTTAATDVVAPTIVSINPASQSVRPDPAANFSFTFNEDVQGVAGKYIQICKASNVCNFDSERMRVDDSDKVTISGATVTINPDTEFAPNSSYYIRIEAGAFVDMNGNSFAGLLTDTFQVYTAAVDGQAPLLRKACTSQDGQTITLLYNERLNSGTLDKSKFTVTDGGVVQIISSVVVPLHSAHVVLTLSSPLPSNSSPLVSYVQNFSGIGDSNSLYSVSLTNVEVSSRADCAGPVLQATVPTNGATGVATNTAITLTFDESIELQFGKSLFFYNYTTNSPYGHIHHTSAEVSVSGNALTITPATPFPASTIISLHTIFAGFVEDSVGNDFWGWESGTTFRFTTGTTADTTAPSAPSTPTLDTASDSGASSSDRITNDATPAISVVAQEAGGLVTVKATRTGQTDVTCTMSGSTSGNNCVLNSLSDGTWLISARHVDSSGNQSSWSQDVSVTIDTSAPSLSSVSPTTNATGVARSSNLALTYSESVLKGSGNFTLLSGATCATTVETISVSSSSISVASNEVTINPAGSFDENTRYCATFTAGLFQDVAGNSVAAMTLASSGRLVFETASNAPPITAVITAPSSPSSSRTLVYAVTFSEAVSGIAPGDFQNDGGTATCTFAVNSSSGITVSVTATCTTDGTVVLKLRENSVMNASSLTGPASSVTATSVTVDTSNAVTVNSLLPTNTVAPGNQPGATTLPPVGNGSPTAVLTPGTLPAVVTTTTVAPSGPTTTLPPIDIPDVQDGGALIVDGERIEATIVRQDNQLLVTAGVLRARISAVRRDGARAPLDSLGRVRLNQGDSIAIEVEGFGATTPVEVRMYSDPVLLGRSFVDATGSLVASYEVPDSVEDGRHTAVLIGESQQKEDLTFALAVFVGDESSGPPTIAYLVGIPLGLAVLGALIIPPIIRRRREEEQSRV